MKRKILSLAIIGMLIVMLFSLTGCVSLLTALGLYAYNEGSEVVNTNSMANAEKEAFNSKFTQYEGKSISGTNVRALLNAVQQSNNSNPDRIVKITGDVTEAKDVKTTNTYTVECKYSNDERLAGLINEISITANTTSTTNNVTSNNTTNTTRNNTKLNPANVLNTTNTTSTSSSKAANDAKISEIKDAVSLLAAEAMTKYYTQTTTNYKSVGDYVAAELKNTKTIKDGYLDVNNKTVTVYSNSSKKDKIVEGTIQDTGSIQWK